MTTPGGVPNLPVGALTLDTLRSRLQDMSTTAMKERAVERFPSIMDRSTGLSPALDVTPFGILTRIFAGTNSLIANSDPADIQGPEDLPELLLEFIEGLPVVGQFVELLEAITGGYDGEDEVLRAISQIFAPIRALLELITGQGGGFPSADEIVEGWENLFDTLTAGSLTAVIAEFDRLVFGGAEAQGLKLPFGLPRRLSIATQTGWFFTNFKKLFGVIDFTNPAFSLPDAVSAFFDVTGLASFLSNVENFLKSITGGTIIGGIVSFWADAVNSLLGLGSSAIPAYTPENAAVATLQGQVNALMADADPATNGAYDGFNTGPSIGSKWATICGSGNPVTSGGYVFSTAFECYRYDDTRPGTTMWQVQASMVFQPGIGAGDSRIFGGADATLTSRFPAIEYAQIGAGNVALRIVSLAGTPDSAANANLGKTVEAQAIYSLFNFKTGDVLALECIEDDAIYNLYLNPGPGSIPVCTYDDTTANLFTRGVGHRDGGLQLNINNDPAFPGNGYDNYACFDR